MGTQNIDYYLERLKIYYNVRFLKGIANRLGIEQTALSVWKSRNAVYTLIKHLTAKDKKALEFMLIEKKGTPNVAINDFLFAKVTEEAERLGIDANKFVEGILAKNLRFAS